MSSNLTSRESTPFGAPDVATRPHVDTLPREDVAEPADLLAFLRERFGRRHMALLESAVARHGPGTTPLRSILVHRPLLRLSLRGGLGAIDLLDERARPLLEVLAARLRLRDHDVEERPEGLSVSCPRTPRERHGVRTDAERLREPSCLDLVRALAGLLSDRHGDRDGPADARPFGPGVVGAFSYDLVDRFEDLPPPAADRDVEPDFSLVLAGDFVVFESDCARLVTRGLPWEEATAVRARHAEDLETLHAARAAARERADAGRSHRNSDHADASDGLPEFEAEVSAEVGESEFERGVSKLLEHVAVGDVFQAVLSRRLEILAPARSLDVYRALRAENPSPYMFHLDLGEGGLDDDALFGASPETFLRVEGREIELGPIAGTAPRGRTPSGIDADLDARLAVGLQLDAKEQAEHAMLIDLARNDVARVAAPVTTEVVDPLTVEKFSHVQHLVSRVRGRLAEGLDALHAYRAAANAGTLTGAPKLRAMELLRGLEPRARGFYGGAVGYLLADGTFDSCIVIRSLRKRGALYVAQSGAGVVAGSVPQREFAETEHKARVVLEAVGAPRSAQEVTT